MREPPNSAADRHPPDSLDLASALEAAQALASQVELPNLLETLTKIMIENAGAQRGYILLPEQGHWVVAAAGAADEDEEKVASPTPLDATLPMTIINYVARTLEPVLLSDATKANRFGRDSYLLSAQPKSLLCLPMLHQRQLIGVAYLENQLAPDAFTPGRLELLNLLATHAAIALGNARLHANLQQAEASARANEQRFRHLFENAPLCMFEVDLAATPAVILTANRRAEAVYGWSAEEFATMSPETLVPPEAHPEIERLMERVRAGETVTIEATNQRRDGTIFPVRIIATPEMGPHADHMVVAVEDVTAEKRRRSEAEAIDEERRRIAQEIHDGVAQDLAALRLRASLWHDLVEASPAQLQVELDELQAILDGGIVKMQRVIFALRPVALDEVGFFPALHQLAADSENQYRVHIDLQISGSEEHLPVDLELPLFRIAQEALHNIGKHAQASVVWITVDLSQESRITLSIRDNGLGFDPASLGEAVRSGHLGLKQMRERVEKAGGTLVVDSRPGQGTEVRAVLPLG